MHKNKLCVSNALFDALKYIIFRHSLSHHVVVCTEIHRKWPMGAVSKPEQRKYNFGLNVTYSIRKVSDNGWMILVVNMLDNIKK